MWLLESQAPGLDPFLMFQGLRFLHCLVGSGGKKGGREPCGDPQCMMRKGS